MFAAGARRQRRMVPLEYIAFEHNNAAAELVKLAYDTPPLAFVHSYGCQQNVNDGERIKGVLMDIGYGLCDKPEDADLILFNTCAVREHAEQRVFGNVGALKGLKEKKRGLIIGLCGCMANQKHVVEKLRQSYPYVDLVFGVDGIDTLPQLIAQKLQKHKRVSEYDSENLMHSVIQEILSDEPFSSIGCAVHFSLATLVKDYAPLTEEERKYARNPLTHVDFLLFNQMDKQPVLAIEVDGTGFHEAGSKQAERDMKKNSVLEKCAVPFLRLRTDGSGEKEKIRTALKGE